MVHLMQILRIKSPVGVRKQLNQMTQMRDHLREILSSLTSTDGQIMHSQPPVPFTVANFNALDMNAALKWKYKGPCGDFGAGRLVSSRK